MSDLDIAAEVGPPEPPPSAPRRSLKKNIIYAVVGTGFFNACRFAAAMMMGKFATPEILGQYNYAFALTDPIVKFFSLHLRATIVADAAGDFTFGTYRKLLRLGMAAAGVLMIGLVVWSALTEPRLAFVFILAAVCLEKIAGAFSELTWGVYTKRERMDMLAWASSFQGLATAIPFCAVVPLYWYLHKTSAIALDRLADGTAIAAMLSAAGWLVVYVVYNRPHVVGQADCNPAWDWPAVRRLAIQVFPLGLIMMIITLCETIPRVIIKNQPGGDAALGFFGGLSYVTMAVNLLLIQAGLAASHRLATYYNSDLPAFIRLTGKLTLMTITLGGAALLGAWLFGHWLLRILYTAEYAAYYPEFLILVFGQCVSLFASTFGIVQFQMRRFWTQFLIHVVVLLTTAAASWWLIEGNPHTVHGAVWAVAIRNVVHAALYAAALFIGIRQRRREAR